MKTYSIALNNDSHVLACCLHRKIDLITSDWAQLYRVSLNTAKHFKKTAKQ